jgi:hypothetical protein
MVLVLTVMARGGRRRILVKEVVGVAQLPSPPLLLSPSPPTPPTYLPCAWEKRAQRGEMAISNSVVRGGGRNRGAVSAGGDEILPLPFSLACGSSHHLHGRSRSCGC